MAQNPVDRFGPSPSKQNPPCHVSVRIQATAHAITLGECESAGAIADSLAKAGGEFDAFSTCGGEADVMEAEPELVEKEIEKAEAFRAARK